MTTGTGGARVAVIGAGPGGYPAAFLAADLGLHVTLIDTEKNPGGVCLYRGCIPSKALLHVAQVLHETQHAAEWGVTFSKPPIDLDKLRAFKDKVVGQLTGGVGLMAKQRKVSSLRGRARFKDAHTLLVDLHDGGRQEVGFDYAIIATGSRPTVIPSLHLDSPRVMDSTAALEIPDIPKSLLVIGGGYIGLEMGSVYAALGSRVTVAEVLPGLLTGADRDLVEPLQKALTDQFEAILLETRVTEMKEQKNGVRVSLASARGEKADRVFDKVLVAVGRRPNTEDLGLEHTRVQRTERGFLQVDAQRRTAEPHIFAIGDVAGEPMLAHKATHEARVAVETIAGAPAAWDPAAIPAVVFTDPELGWTGLTETEARQRGREVDVVKFPWAASGRATTLDRREGLTKILVDPVSHRVLGAGMVGTGAGELIAEVTLAIEMGAVVEDLQRTIHQHPTLSETIMEAADVFSGRSPHYLARQRPARTG